MQSDNYSREKTRTSRKRIKPKKNSRFLELAIIAIFGLLIIYGISFAIRITYGFSKTVEKPRHTIRLQVLNGCGADGAAGRVAHAVPGRTSLPIEVKVVDVDDFNSYDVTRSFIIAREKDLTASRILAEQLGLKTDDIIYRPIENNYRNITATLVLGSDFETAIIKPDSREGE
jgi:preprotein translocase subunit Sss1